MGTSFTHNSFSHVRENRNKGLFSRWSFSGMLDCLVFVSRFFKGCVMNFKDLFVWECREGFLDFENIRDCSLSIRCDRVLFSFGHMFVNL